MKVRVELTVDVDPEAWATEFNLDRNDVRQDVKSYIQGLARDQVEALGLADNAWRTAG